MKKLIPVLFGGMLLILAILGLWVLGRVFNPPAQELLVAVRDLEPGEILTLEAVQVVSVKMDDVQLQTYLTPATLTKAAYRAQVMQAVGEGSFIPLQALTFEDNPAAQSHTTLAMSDPDLVAMVIPVTPLTCPPDVKPGDRVSITVDLGSAAYMSGEFGFSPTREPYNPYSSLRYDLESEAFLPLIYSPLGEPTPAATTVARLTLPITKTVAQAQVLKVLFEIKTVGTISGNSQVEKGDIIGLVVGISANAQEMIGFGISNGQVRVALLSPNAAAEVSTAGMSFDDMVAYFRWNRELWLMGEEMSLPNIAAPGAAVIYPTLMAIYFPPPTLDPASLATATPTATPTVDPALMLLTPTATP